MISLAAIVSDPDFAQDYTVLRSVGAFVKGKWTPGTAASIPFYGVIQPAGPEEIDMIPEGDIVSGALTFHSEQQMYETHTTAPTDPNAGTSDIIPHFGENYKLVKVWPWIDFGYWKALGVREGGQ